MSLNPSPTRELILVTSFHDILAVLLVELIEVLELRRFDGQTISLERDLRTHDHQLSLEVLHDILEEVISHLVEPLAIDTLVVESVLQFIAHRDSQRIHRRDFLHLKVLDLTRKDIAGLGHLARDLAVSHELSRETFADSACNQIEQRVIIHRLITEQIAHEHPRTRRSECARRTLRIEVITVLLGEREITNDILVNVLVHRPLLPGAEVITHLEVNETISQRHRHTISDALVAVAVTSSHDHNIVGQLILAHATIENELVASSLNSRGSRVHLVQKQNDDGILRADLFRGEIDGLSPVHLTDVLVEERNTTDISGFHLCHTHIIHIAAEFISDFLNHFGLADARGTPEEHRALCLECSEESLAGLNRRDSEMIRNLRHFLDPCCEERVAL